MPYVIAEPCIDVKDTACVDVCPVDVIHPRKEENDFTVVSQLYIHPNDCIVRIPRDGDQRSEVMAIRIPK